MSELTDSLRTHGLQHKGTHLGGLLQWAALHIESQDQALADLREEHAREENDRMQMEGALGAAKEAIEAALAAVNSPLWRPIETAPKGERVLLWSEITRGEPFIVDWAEYARYNHPQFTHWSRWDGLPPTSAEGVEHG